MGDDGRLRRKKGSDSTMISGQIEVNILLEDEQNEREGTILFQASSAWDHVLVQLHIKGMPHSTQFHMTPPEFNGVVAQLGKMKSTLNTLKGTNK